VKRRAVGGGNKRRKPSWGRRKKKICKGKGSSSKGQSETAVEKLKRAQNIKGQVADPVCRKQRKRT